jgi:hypothetical protein
MSGGFPRRRLGREPAQAPVKCHVGQQSDHPDEGMGWVFPCQGEYIEKGGSEESKGDCQANTGTGSSRRRVDIFPVRLLTSSRYLSMVGNEMHRSINEKVWDYHDTDHVSQCIISGYLCRPVRSHPIPMNRSNPQLPFPQSLSQPDHMRPRETFRGVCVNRPGVVVNIFKLKTHLFNCDPKRITL